MILVGAPVHNRAWVLPSWFDALAAQETESQDIEIVLNYGAGDDATLDIIENEAERDRFRKITVLEDVHTDHVSSRKWTIARYATMTRLRNDLLAYVRTTSPDFYLSCDTDMLLPSHTLRTLFEHLSQWDGIAPLTFMTPHGDSFPNFMGFNGARGPVPTETTEQDAVFGTVLMTKRLFTQVDYAPHTYGEDIGWAVNADKLGMRLAICPNVRVKHCMSSEVLHVFDDRIGF